MTGGRRRRDLAVAAVAGAVQVLAPTAGGPPGDPPAAAAALGLLLGAGQGLALVARRSHPGRVGAVTTAGLLAQVLVVQPVPPYAAWVATWTAVRHDDRLRVRLGVPLAVLGVLGATALRWPDASGWVPTAAVVTVVLALAAALAEARGARVQALADRAASLERERDTAAERAAVEERLRIARDLHDLVGHGLTGIAVQSSTARVALEAGDVGRATAALAAVEASARDALGEVRQVLGVLRTQPQALPAHGVDDLARLVEAARAAGTDVRLDRRCGDVRPALGLTAYRIVQEALTNAQRHASGAAVRVVVREEGDHLLVEVQDDGAAATAPAGRGHGLVGMRERVLAAGGELTAGPGSEGGWSVRARLPLAGAT